jgi:hypothetical protein
MKLIDESLVITIFEDGKFCWKTRWRQKEQSEINRDLIIGQILLSCLLILLWWSL